MRSFCWLCYQWTVAVGFQWFAERLGISAWAMAGFLFATGWRFSLPGLPLDWYGQFRLEHGSGSNRDPTALVGGPAQRVLLGLALGYPVAGVIVETVD